MSIELPRLSKDFFEAIFLRDCAKMFSYCVVEKTDLAPADAILALGYKDLKKEAQILPKVALKAAELYHQGLAPRVIVSGGVAAPFFQEQSEALVMRGILRSKGVPDSAIVVEDKSTNTQENMLFSRDRVKNSRLSSLIAVGHAIYGRRILMTIAQNWPEIKTPMMSNVWYPGFDNDNWSEDPEYFKLAIAQFERLDQYVAKGFIAEIDLGALNKQIAEVRRTNEPY